MNEILKTGCRTDKTGLWRQRLPTEPLHGSGFHITGNLYTMNLSLCWNGGEMRSGFIIPVLTPLLFLKNLSVFFVLFEVWTGKIRQLNLIAV